MSELLNLAPKALWKHFHTLTQIPRPSKKEERIIAYMKKFGEELGLETIVDEVGNVIIKKPAFKGYEDRKGVILQGHLDMVPQKNSDKEHDFEKDPIEAFVDGEWVTANGTTLGADNGIGVAAAMAVLESTSIQHGPLEALFTIDEETGMTGAFGLKPGLFDGDILINMDSEDEGELYIGCAGGTDANISFTYQEEQVTGDVQGLRISVSGLKGGHSGMDIATGRGNANKILFRFLKLITRKYDFRLSSVDGGSLRNAIPREAFAFGILPAGKAGDFKAEINAFERIVKEELSRVEPGLKVSFEFINTPAFVIDKKTQLNLINGIYGCPNGVMRMSDAMEGLVETSTNLAIVKSDNGKVDISNLMRSSVDTAKDDLGQMIASIFELADAKVWFEGTYPGWKPNPDSEILKLSQKLYNDRFGKIPEIKAIHAGLECGLLGAVYPNWDMISFGPTIRNPHSPDEMVHIETVDKFYTFLLEILKNIPKK